MIQYDYLSAYFDILLGYDTGFKVARKISKEYAEYPVITWRMKFTEILDQLDEFDGKEVDDQEIDLEDLDKKDENMKKLKKLEPSLDFTIENKDIMIDYANIESINVKYYIVNPEILFTREPFEMKNFEMFSYVKPVFQTIKILPQKSKSYTFKIDKKYENQNVLVELDCGKKSQIKTYFPCSLKVLMLNYDELKVVDQDDNPIPRVYVKTFSKQYSGEVKFYKDGYTDMRGKFEYGSTNATMLSIMVLSEKYGCLLKQTKMKNTVTIDADIGFLNTRQAHKYMSHQMKPSLKHKVGKKKGKKF